jgi:hypothetical protein
LLARIRLAKPKSTLADLDKTRDLLVTAEHADPASIELHQLLLRVYQQLGDKPAAEHEQELIDRLESGKVAL